MQIVQSSSRRKPDRILLYGTEGIGKSSWAASAPSPLFIDIEDGLAHLDAVCVPVMSYDQVLSALKEVPPEYKTIVIDTADALESLVWTHLCNKNKWDSIEDPGYGKGYVAALDYWKTILAHLDVLRERGIEIIVIAHAAPKIFNNPAGADYSRYEPKLHKGTSALLKEWSDAILFCCHDETAMIRKGEQKAKAAGTGKRIIHTTHSPAWDAKNRCNLPEILPLDYSQFAKERSKFKTTTPPAGLNAAPSRLPSLTAAPAGGLALADLQKLAAEQSKTAGAAKVREAIKIITGSNLAAAKQDQYEKIAAAIKAVSA